MKYYSQYKQDQFLNENFFKNKKNGIFVDIGAYDGIEGSNSYFFEKHLEWKGLCVEPIPSVFNKLIKNRNCFCEQVAAWKENDIKKFKIIEGYSEMLSGLIDSYEDEHKKRIDSEIEAFNQKSIEIEIQCIDINLLLLKYDLYNIDFLSIDIEGSEIEILKKLDFSKFKIEYISVENNYNNSEIREILKKANFELINRLNIDDIYKNNKL
jgi:FkbM family methyltransferase